MNRKCPIQGCGKAIPTHLAFCKFHWGCTPRSMQQRILRTYRAYINAATLQEKLAAGKEHTSALNEATEVVSKI